MIQLITSTRGRDNAPCRLRLALAVQRNSCSIVLGCLWVAVMGNAAHAQYLLGPITINSGGFPSVSNGAGDYTLVASTGQAGGVGLVQSSENNYTAADGFWHAQSCGPCQLFGDVVDVSFNPVPDCLVDVSDIVCVLQDFQDVSFCAGNGDIIHSDFATCGPDGVIDSTDIISLLTYFSSEFSPCPHPCPM